MGLLTAGHRGLLTATVTPSPGLDSISIVRADERDPLAQADQAYTLFLNVITPPSKTTSRYQKFPNVMSRCA